MNKLTIDTSKTKVMLFGSRHRIKNVNKPEIYLNDIQLQVVPTYRYLGVNLDQTVNYKYHLESLINIISFKLYLFSKVRRFLNEKSAVIVYKTMLLPFFDYCDIVYMFSGVKELRKLDRHHYRGKRICINNSLNIDDTELHNLCNVSDLENRRRVRLRNYMFKNKKKLYH